MYVCRYVYVPTFESGGSFFPKMFRRWIFALFTAQATMVGMCLLKQGFKQAYSVMFLMVLTYVYKVRLVCLVCLSVWPACLTVVRSLLPCVSPPRRPHPPLDRVCVFPILYPLLLSLREFFPPQQ